MKKIYLALLGTCVSFTIFCQVTELSDYLYTIINNRGGNVAVCICPDEVILVDDQMVVCTGEIDSIINNLCETPIGTVINTHFHYDHVDGNKHYGKGTAEIISHYNVRKKLSENQSFWVPPYHQEAFPTYALPSTTFSDSLTIYKSNETIQICYLQNAHTDGDSFIKFKNANVIHTGDVFVTYGLPFIDGTNGGNLYCMISAVSRLIEFSNDSTKIIPGHGEISTRKDLMNYKELLITIEERIRSEIQNGLTLEEIKKQNPYRGLDIVTSQYFDLEQAYFNVKEYLDSKTGSNFELK